MDLPVLEGHEGNRTMIGISLEFTGDSYRELSRLERAAPRAFRAAHGIAAKRAANALRRVLQQQRGGNEKYRVPTFAARHWLTQAIRGGGPNRHGGILANKASIVCYRKRSGQVIGWPDRLAAWASTYQDAVSRPMTKGERRMLYVNYRRRLGGRKVPDWYEKPARPVVEPFSSYLADAFPGYVLNAFEKRVKSLIRKGKPVS